MKSSTSLVTSVSLLESIEAWSPDVIEFDVEQATSGPTQYPDMQEVMRMLGISESQKQARDGHGLVERAVSSWMPSDVGSVTENEKSDGAWTLPDLQVGQVDLADKDIIESQVEAEPEPEPELPPLPSREEVLAEMKKQGEELVAQMVGDARNQAEEMLEKAKREAENIRKQAYEEGVAAGRKEMETGIQDSKTILEQFSFWREGMLKRSEESVLDMVMDISRILFCEGFELDKQMLQQTFAKALLNARALGDLRIYAHPEDAKLLDPAWRDYQVLISGQKVQIFPTDAIQRGGCYVEGQWGSVDARVETQLKAILENVDASKDASTTGAGE